MAPNTTSHSEYGFGTLAVHAGQDPGTLQVFKLMLYCITLFVAEKYPILINNINYTPSDPVTGAVIPALSLSTTFKQEAAGVHKVRWFQCKLLL